MSEAGHGTVELLVPVLFELKRQNNVKRDASRRARLAVWCSSLTRGTQPGTGLVPTTGPLAQVTKPREVRMNAPPKGSCESVCNVLEAGLAKPRLKQLIALMALPGHYPEVFSIDRPPLLAVRRHVNVAEIR
jgi:hypothetical protein